MSASLASHTGNSQRVLPPQVALREAQSSPIHAAPTADTCGDTHAARRAASPAGLAAGYLALIDRRWHRDCAENRHDEYEDILALLAADAQPADGTTLLLAQAVARACLGDDHLWHDLGLPERKTLSDLLRDCFPGLFARNAGNMRWKKFFYLQLCEQAEIRACRAPSCGVCVNFAECFDGEETPLAALRALAEGAR